jgi:glycosyltransferase involved in cell wall biosynthesis
MDTKNTLLQKPIYTPTRYSHLLSIILVNTQVDNIIDVLQTTLKQVYNPFEIIIVDNCNDTSYNIIDNYIISNNLTNVHLHSNYSGNMYECLNVGLRQSKGFFIGFQFNNTSSHLRFIHQINELTRRQTIHSPEMCVCLSNTTDGTMTPSYKSLMFTRNVFNSIGYFIHKYKEHCFEEYAYRFMLYRNQDLNENLYENLPCQVVPKLLVFETDWVIPTPPETKIFASKQTEMKDGRLPWLMTYQNNSPKMNATYLSRVHDILQGNTRERRVTMVYFTDQSSSINTYIKHVSDVFQFHETPIIVCHYKDIPEEDRISYITYVKAESYASGYHTIFSDNLIETPYAFVINGEYTFDQQVIIHPLSYMLDMMDRYVADVNTIRFNSTATCVNETDRVLECTGMNPPITYTSGFSNDPQIVRVRHVTMFKLPYVNKDMRGDDGVSDVLDRKYTNTKIAMKLKTGIYGPFGFPKVCEKNIR